MQKMCLQQHSKNIFSALTNDFRFAVHVFFLFFYVWLVIAFAQGWQQARVKSFWNDQKLQVRTCEHTFALLIPVSGC